MGSGDLVDLVRRIIKGDEQAEAELIQRYCRGMRVIIDQIIDDPSYAEDLAQETLIKALDKIRAGAVAEPERVSGYIRGIAKQMAWDHLKKSQVRQFISVDEVVLTSDKNQDPLEELLRTEEANTVRRVIGKLSCERDRQILTRFYILGEDKESICADLRLDSTYFKGVKFRAVQRFGELYVRTTHEKLTKRPKVESPPG